MELKGVIEGLKILKEPCDVDVTSDSKYVVQAINGWLKSWVKNNWKTAAKKPVKNIDLWKEYLEVSKSHKIIGIWVKGHNGHEENEICDTVARDEAIKFKMGNN
jgi:ribonuclease HI